VSGKLAGLAAIVAIALTAGQLALRDGGHPADGESSEACQAKPAFAAEAQLNAQTLRTAGWSAFGRPETGWEVYVPLTAHEIGTRCAADSSGFAEALAKWQSDHHLGARGAMDEATMRALDRIWQARRAFVVVSARGICPAPPTALVNARSDEGYGGKAIQLRAGTLDAYRRLVSAARKAEPVLSADRRKLTIFSGYRDPAADAARCAAQRNCNSVVRATCSAHRTGLAMDLYLGAAPGFAPDSSADPNRLSQSRSIAYLWMVAHAHEFGFVNYPFEPWHWEWTGEPP
jgi:zinc D-Ala-D-Ala carboxypeptidase